MAEKLRDIDPVKPRTYYQGAKDVISGQMSSMKFQLKELDKLFKVDPQSAMIKQLRQVDNQEVDVDKESVDRVHFVAKEVLRACNVIRPSIADLSTLPVARKQAKSALRLDKMQQ